MESKYLLSVNINGHDTPMHLADNIDYLIKLIYEKYGQGSFVITYPGKPVLKITCGIGGTK